MLAPKLTELVDKVDVFELVRDQIGALLLIETEQQQLLATAAARDPTPWDLRVYTERTNPFGEFVDLVEGEDPPRPIVNVSYSGSTYIKSSSNVVERQRADSTYFIDCYAVAVSQDVAGGGHRPGDELAALEVQRVIRLVRNYLMSAEYTYLGLRGTVGGRWIASIETMDPQLDALQVQRVGAARITLTVDHSEYSPQVRGEPLELLSLNVRRAADGELSYFTATFPGV